MGSADDAFLSLILLSPVLMIAVVVVLIAKVGRHTRVKDATGHSSRDSSSQKTLAVLTTPNQSQQRQYIDGVVSQSQPRQPAEYVYSRRHFLMTKHERYFYRRLHHIFGKFYLIFPQVHLNDLFVHDHYGQNWKGALSRIQRKSVDYVLCTVDLKIVAAIELDDNSHHHPERQQRDEFVEKIFRESGMPLVRFSQVETLADQLIHDKVAEAIGSVTAK